MEYIKKIGFLKALYILVLIMTVPVVIIAYAKLNFAVALPFVLTYLVLALLLTGMILVSGVINISRLPLNEFAQRMVRSLLYFVGACIILGTLKFIFHPETFDLTKLLLKGAKIAIGLTFGDLIFIKSKKDTLEE